MKKIFSLHFKIPFLIIFTIATSLATIWAESKYLFGGEILENLSNNDFLLTACLTAVFFSLLFGLAFSASFASILEKISRSAKKIVGGQYDLEIKNRPLDEIGELVANFEKLRLWVADHAGSWEEEKNKAEAILDNIGDSVMAVDLKGNIFLFNKMAEEITGLKKTEVMGQPFYNLIKFFNRATGDDVTSFINQSLISVQLTKPACDVDMFSTKKAKIPVATVATPIKGQKTLIAGAIVVFRDVTQELELERMRTDLISITSHQLRTPLAEIKGLVELLIEGVGGKLAAKQLELLHDTQKATQRMIDLVNDLLNITRLEQGKIKFNFQVLEIAKLVSEVFGNYQPEAEQKHQNFVLTLPPKRLFVSCDSDKTKEVIDNFIANALKYTPQGGTINVWVDSDERGVWVVVKDNGVGIPKDKQGSLFQKFSRIPNPLSQEAGGIGLGLYAAKQLVQQQNGQIWFESEERKGSTFAFILPEVKE